MISGIFHKGSGFGNQLFRYIATRILAEEKGYDFSMIAPELFKGKDFMSLNMGLENKAIWDIQNNTGKVFTWSGSWGQQPKMELWEEWSKYCYDPDFNFIEDNTIIDGNFEDERYFIHRLDDIKEWLRVEPLEIPDDVCVIGFRGGEFYTVPELGLPIEYFERAIKEVQKINPKMKFEVHTDDPVMARQFFPNYPIIRDISINCRSMRYAKWAIVANSSFYILPRLLNGGVTIAPKYWNRYNTKKWDYPQNYYRQFTYI